MLTWSSSESSRGSLKTFHHCPRSAPSLGCASFQPAGGASFNAGGAPAPGRWDFGPLLPALDHNRPPAVPQTSVELFIPESLNRIHERRLARRVVAKEHSHQRGKQKRQQDRQGDDS